MAKKYQNKNTHIDLKRLKQANSPAIRLILIENRIKGGIETDISKEIPRNLKYGDTGLEEEYEDYLDNEAEYDELWDENDDYYDEIDL